jgi:hypothetical protein
VTKVHLEKDSETEVTRYPEGDDAWDRGNTHTRWSFGRVYLHPPRRWMESYETDFDVHPGDVLHLVVAVSSTGDSFGRDSGRCSEVMGVFRTGEEADACQASLEGLGVEGTWRPWDGYFDSLDYITVLEETVIAGWKEED